MPCSCEGQVKGQEAAGGVSGICMPPPLVLCGSTATLPSCLFSWHVDALTAPTVPFGRSSRSTDPGVSRAVVAGPGACVFRCDPSVRLGTC